MKIQSKTEQFISIFSDNDPYVSLKFADIFKKKLEAINIIKHSMNHFSGPVDDEKSCTTLPDVSKPIFRMNRVIEND